MKHLLIILSILLLSSPLFGQETGVLYQYETSSGIKWKTFGNEKVQPKYEGEIKNGDMWFILHGLGVITFPYDGKSIVGEWIEGDELNTKHTKKDGTLIGKYENGKWIVSWGVLYLGYRNGKYGWYEDGDEKNDGKYVGEIKNGLPNGQGTETDLLGGKYVGDWKNGEKHGQGTFTFPDGKKYVGDYKDGTWNGQGTFTFPDGGNYVGSWKDGKFHGQGTYTYHFGEKYVGEWKDGGKNGRGTMTYPDGDKYVGEYKDGGKNGQGTYIYSDGSKYVGEYKNQIPWNGKIYDQIGNIIGKYVNGKQIKQ